ncbi:Glutamate carboxypeptidase II [Candidatus Koribacter versatilis Ellin345]|uniref:Glutamate carboxypeptidase II n=1 Tax=Koribacter versatilis (strain Ellin345) TaxID=204669 RepID=Q1INT3_KORVE|nr:M28 family metallopeptidase [Candidatus Koribacter versatilis]ABF41467.1 Glutamate carboxypeptidase II [Candidatus Koribacter versatilis Ellin345]
MRPLVSLIVFWTLLIAPFLGTELGDPTKSVFEPPNAIAGFEKPIAQLALEKKFLAVPDPKHAEQDMRALTATPHLATTPEDRKTADYVLQKFKEAGLQASIEEYKVYFGIPESVSIDIVAPEGVVLHGPSPERVDGDDGSKDSRILPAFNGYTPSADVTAEVLYANYGRPEDFDTLAQAGVDVKGKLVIIRYGEIFRGVKVLQAQQRGAAGVILYSDPMDDGYFKGDVYPKGPYRPSSAVQRGDVHFMFRYPGDPTTPGAPSSATAERTEAAQSASLPKIPVLPLSYADASPILQHLAGPESPRSWQGALPFTYHLGVGPVKVHLKIAVHYEYRTIWNVIGTVKGAEYPSDIVLSGNHRDAWVFGAADPGSGTVAQLEAVRGIGQLLKAGWRPKRTIIFASWDAEEQGMVGSTEWVEQHAQELSGAVAYFNMDVAVTGPNFAAASVPSLKQFMRDVAKSVPSPQGGSVYDAWTERTSGKSPQRNEVFPDVNGSARHSSAAPPHQDVAVGDLGSGSDYTPFLEHIGVASADMGSHGPYGVYHSAFDDYTWFTKFADPKFAYEQQMARLHGLQVLRMADADVLPFDYEDYGQEIEAYIEYTKQRAAESFPEGGPKFDELTKASKRLQSAGSMLLGAVKAGRAASPARINTALRDAERAFLTNGLPSRPWFRHAIYAPGESTGYEAIVLPGITEAIEHHDQQALVEQIQLTTAAINHASEILESAHSF